MELEKALLYMGIQAYRIFKLEQEKLEAFEAMERMKARIEELEGAGDD